MAMPKESFFAIRDDDTSFFTDPDELEAVYGAYFGRVPISLAVVPFAVSVHQERCFTPDYPNDAEVPLETNGKLVEWIKNRIGLGHVEIVLHGYSHLYREERDGWKGEYHWKTDARLAEETRRGRAYLETLLETRIRVFVPPGNTIGKGGIRAVRRERMDLCGLMGRGGDRPWSRDYAAAYIRRWAWRLLKGSAYPFPLACGGIRELRSYALTPRADPAALARDLETCARIDAPFVLATHYWEFAECPAMHDTLSALVIQARRLGMEFVPVSRCFGRPVSE